MVRQASRPEVRERYGRDPPEDGHRIILLFLSPLPRAGRHPPRLLLRPAGGVGRDAAGSVAAARSPHQPRLAARDLHAREPLPGQRIVGGAPVRFALPGVPEVFGGIALGAGRGAGPLTSGAPGLLPHSMNLAPARPRPPCFGWP